MNNLPTTSYPRAVLKNVLPSESQSHETRIIEITNIITATAQNKIAIIILFGPFATGYWITNSSYNFLILTKDKKIR